MKVSDWIALFTLLVAAAGVIVVLVQTRKLSQQLLLGHFSQYTKRYQEIIVGCEEDIYDANFGPSRPGFAKAMRHMRAYIDLFREEWYLHQRGLCRSHKSPFEKRGSELSRKAHLAPISGSSSRN